MQNGKILFNVNCVRELARMYHFVSIALLPTKFLHAINVFFINIVTVIGPTPPGTGVINPATPRTSINRQNKKN